MNPSTSWRRRGPFLNSSVGLCWPYSQVAVRATWSFSATAKHKATAGAKQVAAQGHVEIDLYNFGICASLNHCVFACKTSQLT